MSFDLHCLWCPIQVPQGKFRCDNSIFTPFRRTGPVIGFAGGAPQREILLVLFSCHSSVPWNIFSYRMEVAINENSFTAAIISPTFKQFIIQRQRFIFLPSSQLMLGVKVQAQATVKNKPLLNLKHSHEHSWAEMSPKDSSIKKPAFQPMKSGAVLECKSESKILNIVMILYPANSLSWILTVRLLQSLEDAWTRSVFVICAHRKRNYLSSS